MALYISYSMLIRWLVPSKLSKEPSQLHNTAPAAFLIITITCTGLQSHYAGTMFKTVEMRRPQICVSTFVSHKTQGYG